MVTNATLRKMFNSIVELIWNSMTFILIYYYNTYKCNIQKTVGEEKEAGNRKTV